MFVLLVGISWPKLDDEQRLAIRVLLFFFPHASEFFLHVQRGMSFYALQEAHAAPAAQGDDLREQSAQHAQAQVVESQLMQACFLCLGI